MILHRKFLVLMLIILSAFPSFAEEYTAGDVIVVLRPSEGEITASSFGAAGAGTLRAAEFAQLSGASVKNIYPALSEAGKGIFMVMHTASQDAEELSARLLKNPEVIAASPNYTIHAAMIPNDTSYGSCWGMMDINAPEAWDIATGSSDVYVAIIDSGIDDTNPDLTDNVATVYGTNTLNAGASVRDDYGHGTHVAGIIGAKGNNGIGIAGINWNVKMISIKALNRSGKGSFQSVISAINYVVGLLNRGVNVRAVNMSMETYLSIAPEHDILVQFPLWRAMKALDETNKAVMVVAAGNHGQVVGQPSTGYKDNIVNRSGLYVYPASFRGLYNMITVSALNRLGFIAATYSNTGADISAPGGELTSLLSSAGILSTWLQSASDFITSDGVSLRAAQGTSMAAPHISGAAALLSSVAPQMTAYQLKQAILMKNEASGSSVNTSATGTLDIRAAINFQAANSKDIPASSDKWVSYDNYASYEADNTVINNNGGNSSGGSGGGGGCEGLAAGFAGICVLFMLARKRMS